MEGAAPLWGRGGGSHIPPALGGGGESWDSRQGWVAEGHMFGGAQGTGGETWLHPLPPRALAQIGG